MPDASPLQPFYYELPPERIAQRPAQPPDAAKLLVVERSAESLRDSHFHTLPVFLSPGDLLVFNDTKVLPARFFGRLTHASSASSPEVEVLLLKQHGAADSPRWVCIGRPLKRFLPGAIIFLSENLCAEVVERLSDQEVVIRFYLTGDPHSSGDDGNLLRNEMQRVGSMPIPPYIRKGRGDDQDRADYQTIFASVEGSIAAPTASLHFTEDLLGNLKERGVESDFVTLHVGASSIRAIHRDHESNTLSSVGSEFLSVRRSVLDRIRRVKSQGGRVVAVGTTVVRALESAWRQEQQSESPTDSIACETDLFITPGFTFQAIDGLVTNFHQPGTTHLLLVEAFLGAGLLKSVYARALAQEYRFLSYGDGCLLL